MRNEPTPVHEDLRVDDAFWLSRGFAMCDNTARFQIFRNYIRDASGRYKGYLVYDMEEPISSREYLTITTLGAARTIAKIFHDRRLGL